MIKYYRTDTRLGEADLTPPEEGRKKKGMKLISAETGATAHEKELRHRKERQSQEAIEG
jgi:hypothetical protein